MALAALAASYAAAEIVLPILLAFVLNLVFRPVLRLLLRARLPQPLAALIIVLSLVALFIALAVLLSGPISGWIGRLPETLPRIEQRLQRRKAGVQPEESVEIDGGIFRPAGGRNRQRRASGIVGALAERHDHVEPVDGAALENRDQYTPPRVCCSDCSRQKRWSEAKTDEGQPAVFEKDAA